MMSTYFNASECPPLCNTCTFSGHGSLARHVLRGTRSLFSLPPHPSPHTTPQAKATGSSSDSSDFCSVQKTLPLAHFSWTFSPRDAIVSLLFRSYHPWVISSFSLFFSLSLVSYLCPIQGCESSTLSLTRDMKEGWGRQVRVWPHRGCRAESERR